MGFTYSTKLVQQLVDLAIIDSDSVEIYSSSTRDDPNQIVWRCKKSGVIFLEPNKNLGESKKSEDLSYWGVEERAKFLLSSEEDDKRRLKLINPYLENTRYLDIGTGLGGILDRAKGLTEKIVAVEPQKAARQTLQGLNYEVYEDITHIEGQEYDLVTLFHVFEHLHNPLKMLKEIASRMASNGKLVIEVPHANDALLSLYKCDAFKNFTLWSEHLILHTKESLSSMLESVGFEVESIYGTQRYNFANHQYWLSHGKPGGHKVWEGMFEQKVCVEYSQSIEALEMSDTLITVVSLK